jgi:predicted ABC-type ATPase
LLIGQCATPSDSALLLRRLDLPNGAGKSTFVKLTLAPLLSKSVFVNADEIAKHRWPTDPPAHAYEAARVAVNADGHDVPEDKIRQRYQRLWALVVTAITRCDSATVYDNSALKGPRIVAQMSCGHPIGAPTWPVWTPQGLSLRWPA